MEKIILLLTLCISQIFFGMQEESKLSIVTLGNQPSSVFDKAMYEQTLVELPCTSFQQWWDDATTVTKDLNAQMRNAKWSTCNPKPVLFASEKRTLFALHYLAKNPTVFSALILQDAQLDDYNYILNLHRDVPANIPVIFFTEKGDATKNAINRETNILYAKMQERSETELKTYLIPKQGDQDLGIVQHINDILIRENLLHSTPAGIKMESLQLHPSLETTQGLRQTEKREKMVVLSTWIGAACLVIAGIYALYKTGIGEKVISLQTCIKKKPSENSVFL